MSIKHGIKRKLIQAAAFGFSNFHISNFAGGKLYTGKWKNFCNPGLNCYSCPAASLACPIGALQAVTGSRHYQFSFYVTGLILALGVIFGRMICGFFCPFGLIQELISLIPVKKFRLPGWMTYIKYLILLIFVLLIPEAMSLFSQSRTGIPAFCEFICPAGTLEGGIPMLLTHKELHDAIGPLFALKALILAIVIIGCIFIHRFFCKTLCPLGAIYGLLNKISILKLHVNEKSCTHCSACSLKCPMDVDPVKHPDSAECIRCLKCAEACPTHSISIKAMAKQITQQ